jgi:hypothetical protein
MGATITHNETLDNFSPVLVQTRKASLSSQTVVRFPIGSTEPYITFGPAGLRSGQHVLFFDEDPAAANAAADVLATPGSFELELTSPEQPAWSMSFVVIGVIEIEQDDQEALYWTVRFGFQEISP